MLPTGFTHSSLAKRFMPSTASRTCGVGRRVFRSCSRRVTRLDAGEGVRRIVGRAPGTVGTLGAIRSSGSSTLSSRCVMVVPSSLLQALGSSGDGAPATGQDCRDATVNGSVNDSVNDLL